MEDVHRRNPVVFVVNYLDRKGRNLIQNKLEFVFDGFVHQMTLVQNEVTLRFIWQIFKIVVRNIHIG